MARIRKFNAGNIGPTLLDTLAQSLEAAGAAEPVPLPELRVDGERVLDSTGVLALTEVPATLAVVAKVPIETLRHVVAPHPSVNQIWNPLLARQRERTTE